MSENREQSEGLRELAEIDRVIHEPSRLRILMYLYYVEKADFVFLVNATELTWGNLSSHVSKLEEAGYVRVEKGFLGKKPHTMVQLTQAGRQAVDSYRQKMQAALGNLQGRQDRKQSQETQAQTQQGPEQMREGWEQPQRDREPRRQDQEQEPKDQ